MISGAVWQLRSIMLSPYIKSGGQCVGQGSVFPQDPGAVGDVRMRERLERWNVTANNWIGLKEMNISRLKEIYKSTIAA